MTHEERIARINELARKKKTVGLTEEELAEQKVLREEYLAIFRANFRAQLDRIEFVDEPAESGEQEIDIVAENVDMETEETTTEVDEIIIKE